MRSLFLALLFVLPLSLFAQDNADGSGKFSLGFSFSRDYCYRSLSTDDTAAQGIVDSRNDMEVPRFSYTTGVKLAYRPTKKLSLEIGLLFSDKGEKTKNLADYYNVYDPLAPTKSVERHHYYYLDVPMKVSYQFASLGKGGFYVAGAFSPNFYLSNRSGTISKYDDGEKTHSHTKYDHSYFSSVNLSFTAGLGYQTELTDKLTLKIEPTYRRSINSISNQAIKSYLYSFGVDFGLYMKL